MTRIRSLLSVILWCGAMLVAVVASSVAPQRDETAEPPLTLCGSTMGTSYTIKVAGASSALDPIWLKSQIDAVLAAVDGRMSTYDSASELSRFNRSTSTDWFPLSADTAAVMAEAVRLGRLTDGSLDVTVGPLVELWNFGPGRRDQDVVPSDADIAATAARVGIEQIDVRLTPPSARKTTAGVHVDLSAIAKGYAVDRVASRLEQLGLTNYMVEVGGETRTRGCKSLGQPWRIAIESPAMMDTAETVIGPGSLAMATSGDYRNYYESGGVRYSHIIDPKTARPVRHRLASVSVLDPSCATADGLATAMMVLGADDAFALAERLKLPVLLLVKTPSGFEQRMTPQFASLIVAAE